MSLSKNKDTLGYYCTSTVLRVVPLCLKATERRSEGRLRRRKNSDFWSCVTTLRSSPPSPAVSMTRTRGFFQGWVEMTLPSELRISYEKSVSVSATCSSCFNVPGNKRTSRTVIVQVPLVVSCSISPLMKTMPFWSSGTDFQTTSGSVMTCLGPRQAVSMSMVRKNNPTIAIMDLADGCRAPGFLQPFLL